jgi:hypothetical protein
VLADFRHEHVLFTKGMVAKEVSSIQRDVGFLGHSDHPDGTIINSIFKMTVLGVEGSVGDNEHTGHV